ncbi:TATA-binding protein-associated factor 172 [Lucilia sericata]|uniref:TATA-binding protein-associated factor 172 n=1 Tax=Lucilia sericata TaxID=13632 RepID=UPI0018A80F46|nr:TATA-binding protein-associated factor 172 [Lucilia sericata]XP_037813786.1 TATA-binding protein-associated factor 172 [Lucilia sericata]XP_037813788.1 TATA-binding protein-associated factor 172 [Lucilia sericata]
MTSRLDRLFILLESGSSAVTRRAAAKQIGEIQKLYPHELHALLNRLIGYLHSSSWDTRIAAAQTVEAILANVPDWKPELNAIKREVKKEENVATGDEDNSCQSNASSTTTLTSVSANSDYYKERYLTFSEFNLEQVLKKGARLIGSEGNEFDCIDDTAGAGLGNADTAAERLSRQRALLNEKLGLTQASKLGVNLTDMISDEDMMRSGGNYNVNEEKVPVEHILNIKPNIHLIPSNGQQLSCREMNRAKRKARQSATAGSTTTSALATASSSSSSANGSMDEPEKKRQKTGETHRQEIFYSLNDPVPDATGMWIDAVHWPLENFCARLYVDLFNAKWEVRHGAATALRELINQQAGGAGKSLNMTIEEMQHYHNLWLEDAALRLLCVLCLDRFGDFVSDQVVAPVRETCAQVLGTIVKEMDANKVHEIVFILRTLLKQSEWEVRHGGLLGLKYVFVVREDLLQIYLPQSISDILMGLFDTVDDVGAVAASTLTPVASWLPKLLNPTQVSSIVKMLWDLLLDQDELTSASNNFMGLLAAILCLPNASMWIQMEPMSTLIPRLWPFLSHSTSSVRKSTLVTLDTLTRNATVKEKNIAANVCGSEGNNTAVAAVSSKCGENFSFDSKNLRLNFGVIDWQWKLLQEALRHVFQRILVEPHEEIQQMARDVWLNLIANADLGALLHAACPFVSSWICLAMQPPRLSFDPSILIQTTSAAGETSDPTTHRRRHHKLADDLGGSNPTASLKLYLGGSESTPIEVREKNYIRARVTAARVLGSLSHYLVKPAPGVIYTAETESPMDCYTKVLLGHLNSRSAVQRLVCGLIIAFWAKSDPSICPGPSQLQEKLRYCIMEYVYYDEVAVSLTRLHQETHDFIATLKQYKIPINDFGQAKVLTLDQIESVATTLTADLRKYALKPKILQMLEERRKGLQSSFLQTSAEQSAFSVSTQAALAGAIVYLKCLPEKLNPVVKPLMESVKREESLLLQELSCEFLVQFMAEVCDRNPSPNGKLLTNLSTLLKSDTEFTPKILNPSVSLKESPVLTSASDSNSCIYYGILTLSLQQHTPTSTNRSNSVNAGTNVASATPIPSTSRGPGRPPLSESLAATAVSEITSKVSLTEVEMKKCRIQRLGATGAITKLCQHFGSSLLEKIPILEQLMFHKIEQFVSAFPKMETLAEILIDVGQTNDLMTSLQLIEIAAPHFHSDLHEKLFQLLQPLGKFIGHPLKAVRHMASRCLATLAHIDPCRIMDFVVNHILSLLQKIENIIERQGAIETIERVVEKLQIRIVPYIVLLVVPLLGAMSDNDECVRLLSTHCFATLIQLMPLDTTAATASNGIKHELKSADLQARKSRDREFLDYLFAPKTIPNYKVPVPISVELRSYQQAGINWLWFLNKYNLHGILCDDMGLGKTLQTICILAGDHHQRAIEKCNNLPSLVICPPTLTGHWVYEVDKFLKDPKTLIPLHYVGLPSCRERLRGFIGTKCNLVVASYDTIRKDIDFFRTINWNYCVLDEGHIIKNGKTKSSKAIKMLKANHRLILSGTPIQNNVLELWSLFDFLMPGFLGTEKQFIARYSRPIFASRDAKSSAKEQEAGVLAMEALHRQVLPFLLRRVKEDVLTDLPPKITQDLLCELSPLQERLYEDFSRTHLNSEIKDCLENGGEFSAKTHIFHALRYLQNVCNHPKLVLTPKHPEFARITQELNQQQSSLNDIEHSAKLPALKQLLLDCGIGVQTESVSQHRALIFCQLKVMLDIVEKDLLKKHLPTVTYLRLDGSVPASMRQDIVNNFNTDPSIDVLLLTTQVGGLGLNLTGADTVIFVEHDWNPMKDLQAMDRAHRIGQKKVVNVYRLITRKSMEEKIMCLQKFKLLTANTVVSAENASLDTMATGQIFDLFNLNERNKNGNDKTNSNTSSTGQMSMNSIIENLPELWSEQQYDEEYDMSNFVQALKK